MDNNKKKRKFNIIDVLIIAIIIVSVLIFANYKKFSNSEEEVIVKTSYVVLVADIEQEDIGIFDEDEEIMSNKDGRIIGKIAGVDEYEEQMAITADAEKGAYITTSVPDRYTVKLTIESLAVKKQDGILLDETYLKVGKEIDLKTNKYTTRATVLAVKEG